MNPLGYDFADFSSGGILDENVFSAGEADGEYVFFVDAYDRAILHFGEEFAGSVSCGEAIGVELFPNED